MVEGKLMHRSDSMHGGESWQRVSLSGGCHASLVVFNLVNDGDNLGRSVDGIIIVPLVDIQGVFGMSSSGITNTVPVIALKKVIFHRLFGCHLHHSKEIHYGCGFEVFSTSVAQDSDREVIKPVIINHILPTPHNEIPIITGITRWCNEVVVLSLEVPSCVRAVHVENYDEVLKKGSLNKKLGEVLKNHHDLLPHLINKLVLLLEVVPPLLMPDQLVLHILVPLLLVLSVEREGLFPLFFFPSHNLQMDSSVECLTLVESNTFSMK